MWNGAGPQHLEQRVALQLALQAGERVRHARRHQHVVVHREARGQAARVAARPAQALHDKDQLPNQAGADRPGLRRSGL